MRKNLNIAIVGATGVVGRKIFEVLNERKIDANFYFFAEKDDFFYFFDKKIEVFRLNLENLPKLDYAFFAVDSEISKTIAPEFVKRNITVIDNSNAFRRDSTVPLVVPQVNGNVLTANNKLIANPNCSTIQLVTALKPLDDKFKIKRIVISTYQAVSGAGIGGICDLENNTQTKFDYPIVNNVIPHIDMFLENGYTKEEDKLIFETKKIMSRPKIKITATAVRVPVINGHSESVNVEFEEKTDVKWIKNALKSAKNVILQDNPDKKLYPMPIFCSGKDEVFVGRIRKDFSQKNAFNLWIVADNLRRGAASNAVDIFETMEKIYEKSNI